MRSFLWKKGISFFLSAVSCVAIVSFKIELINNRREKQTSWHEFDDGMQWNFNVWNF